MMAYVRPTRLLATALIALVAAACADDVPPLFEVNGTGNLEGFVFLDADRNGVFDPSAGDTPLPNVRVEVKSRGTNETLAGGTATAGTNGRFVVNGLPAGTHDLRIDTLSLPAGARICANPIPVDIRINETSFAGVGGRPACIVTIAQAEATPGTTVVIQGIVTSAPGETRVQYTYIQDETGGIRIFSGVPEGKGIAIGDLIEVTGVVSEFSRDLQLGGTVVLGAITKNVQTPVPLVMTTGALNAAASSPASMELGMLVRLRKARIETAFGANGINGRNVIIDDGTGRVQIRFETAMFPAASTAEAQTLLNTRYPIGKCYDITGVTGLFNTDAQIFPRSLNDLTEVPCS